MEGFTETPYIQATRYYRYPFYLLNTLNDFEDAVRDWTVIRPFLDSRVITYLVLVLSKGHFLFWH